MTRTTATRTPLLGRLLDRGRTWGAVEVSASRYGVMRYRLVVFPPGLSRDDRIALRLWRSFPVWGLASWLLVEVALVTALTPSLALAISTGGCLTAGAVTMVLAGPTRGEVRTLTVVRMLGVDDRVVGPRFDELRAFSARLANADARLAAGELSAVGHEAEVWAVYDAMPSA